VTEQSSAVKGGRREPIVEFGSYPVGEREPFESIRSRNSGIGTVRLLRRLHPVAVIFPRSKVR